MRVRRDMQAGVMLADEFVCIWCLLPSLFVDPESLLQFLQISSLEQKFPSGSVKLK